MKKILLLLLLAFSSSQTFAQAPITNSENVIQNQKIWFGYFGNFRLSPKWGIINDVQFRMDENFQYANQSILRAGLVRYVNPKINLAAGYAFINTFQSQFTGYFSEHRIWEQAIYNQVFQPKINMAHRLRLEQRFIEQLKLDDLQVKTNGYKNDNRLRYFNRTVFDFNKAPEATSNFYVALQDEVFLNFKSNEINTNFFDQNRFMVALGILHNSNTRFELGYMNQYVNNEPRLDAMNHILQVSVYQNLNFMKPSE